MYVHLGRCIMRPPRDGLFVGGQIVLRAVVGKLRVGGRVEGGPDASHSGWTADWQVGEWRGQGHGQEGGWDVSHSGWTAAWQVGERRGQGHGQEGGQDVSH